MFVRSVLSNGLRILTCPMPHVRSATLGFYVGTGSRHERADKAGLSHFLEHMLFKGTRSYPQARHISEAIEGIGGVLDATTSPEATAYWAKVPGEHFPRALDVLSDMLLHPRLEPAEVEKERRVIIEELHMVSDSPADWVWWLASQALWPDHPLGRDVAGTEQGVASIDREDLQAYREERYAPQQIVAVVAGAPSTEEVSHSIAAVFGDLPTRPSSPPEPFRETAGEPRILLGYRDIEQANVCLAVPALSYHHPDRYPLLLLNTILGSGMSSRLFQEVREERALVYNIYSSLRHYADTGAAIIYAGVDPENLEECLAAVWQQLERLAAEPVSPEELARAKEYNKGRILLRMEDSYGVASWYGTQEILLNRIEEVDEAVALIEAVRAEDIQRLAETLFQRTHLRLAVVGPFREDTTIRRALGLDG